MIGLLGVLVYSAIGWLTVTKVFVPRYIDNDYKRWPSIFKLESSKREAAAFGVMISLVWPFYLMYTLIQKLVLDNASLSEYEKNHRDKKEMDG